MQFWTDDQFKKKKTTSETCFERIVVLQYPDNGW